MKRGLILLLAALLAVGLTACAPDVRMDMENTVAEMPLVNSEERSEDETVALAGKGLQAHLDAFPGVAQGMLYLVIYDETNCPSATATGIVVGEADTFVTSYDAIASAHHIVAYAPGAKEGVEVHTVLGYDEMIDLAVLRGDSSFGVEPVNTASMEDIQREDPIYVLGHSRNLEFAVEEGAAGSHYFEDDTTECLQLYDVDLVTSLKGGAVLNADKELIAIVSSARSYGEYINIAVSCAEIETVLAYGMETTLEELYTQIFLADLPVYTVDYVIEHYDDLLESNYYVEGWVSTFSTYAFNKQAYLYLVSAPELVDRTFSGEGGSEFDSDRVWANECILIHYRYGFGLQDIPRTPPRFQTGSHVRVRCFRISEPMYFEGDIISWYSLNSDAIQILND